MRAWPWAALGAAGVGVAGWLWVDAQPPAGEQSARATAPIQVPAAAPLPLQARVPVSVPPAVMPAATAVAASSPARRRPLPAWSQLTLATPLADVLAAAQASGSPGELLVAGRLLAACSTARGWKESQLAAINDMRLSGMATEQTASAAARQSSRSHQTMLRYCAALDDAAIDALAQSLLARMGETPNTWRTLAGQPGKQPGEGWPQEQYQAALLTLTDPAAQAAMLETVLRLLSPAVPPGRAGLNTYQADVVRALVAQELTGDRNPASIANTTACVQRAVCDVGTPAFAADPANRAVLAAAQHWVQLIRAQQWAAIGLLPR